MSASTVPAASPEPSSNAGTGPQNTPAPGLFASMVAPVQPARTAFNLAPATTGKDTADDGAGLPADGVSSASFNDENGTPNSNSKDAKDTGSGKQQTGIMRAWLIAGATRWGRGGGTANKRLDMRKARAQAQQVKETRTVTINRTPTGTGGGTTRTSNAAGPAGGKGLGGKSGGGGASKGPQKNTGPGSKNGTGPGSSGKSGNTSPGGLGSRGKDGGSGGSGAGTGRGTGSGGAGGTKNTPAPKQPKAAKTDTPTIPKQQKAETAAPKPSKGSAGAGGDQKNHKPGAGSGGTSGTKSSAGTAGKNGASPKTPTPAKDTKTAPDTKPPTGGGTGPGKDLKDAKQAATERKKWSLTKGDKPAKPDTKTPPTTGTGKDKSAAAAADKKPDAKAAPDPKATTGDKPATDEPSPKPTTSRGKPFTVKESRETGYRDGTRAAKVAAHTQAYRHGIKDGWADTMAAADQEKTSLDQAHADRKQARQETPVTTATSADHQTADPTPIEVASVTKTHVFLGAGDNRGSMTRGEIRCLKGFERRLEERATSLTNKAEATRGLKAHAEEQATQATRLLDAARSAKAGDKYIGTLTRLQEAAKGQATKADEIHKQALRGAELCRTTLANVQARYGGIYQAVVDSPETSPAELDFYKG